MQSQSPPATAPTPTPIANVLIERMNGSRHQISLTIKLSTLDGAHHDADYVMRAARHALEPFAHDARFDFATVKGTPKAGPTVVSVEASAVCPTEPDDETIARIRGALVADGYRVNVRERRHCTHQGCLGDTVVEHKSDVPRGWYTSSICGKHQFKTCPECKSVYLMTSSNVAGQAESLHCEVCGIILVEWGSSKIWEAQLVTRGRP